jgi:hypothetical protein
LRLAPEDGIAKLKQQASWLEREYPDAAGLKRSICFPRNAPGPLSSFWTKTSPRQSLQPRTVERDKTEPSRFIGEDARRRTRACSAMRGKP